MRELGNKEYRDSFVSSEVDVSVAFQIRALRKQREWSQEKLAESATMKQERISALENPSNVPNISTLKKLANAFNIGLIVRFVPISEMMKWKLNLTPESLDVQSFDQEDYFKNKPPAIDKFTLTVGAALQMPGTAGMTSILKEYTPETYMFASSSQGIHGTSGISPYAETGKIAVGGAR
jgi:transcriptional regulator with XRE-family HTH domain